jgi:hypothetical protein
MLFDAVPYVPSVCMNGQYFQAASSVHMGVRIHLLQQWLGVSWLSHRGVLAVTPSCMPTAAIVVAITCEAAMTALHMCCDYSSTTYNFPAATREAFRSCGLRLSPGLVLVDTLFIHSLMPLLTSAQPSASPETPVATPWGAEKYRDDYANNECPGYTFCAISFQALV